ncbi:GtrA family protein [Barnesiella viscericola]|uniref:GtrA family protein n=1 Tax=Barnesiella viscericola TaxID=397865 RepID=A0A921SV41_9BACT|nr:GtrA family protein [Barnesiella viscericola]HJG88942.1 GtrA family protein [Barnesiella viscericola]
MMKPGHLFKRLFYGTTDRLLVQFVRYFFVGGFAFVVDFGLLYILTEYAGLHYLLSATLSFISGLLVNYIISCIWVFSNSKFKNRLVEFLFFAAIGVVGLLLNDALIWLFTDCIGTHYMFSKIVAAAIVYLWNFFARKYLVFR